MELFPETTKLYFESSNRFRKFANGYKDSKEEDLLLYNIRKNTYESELNEKIVPIFESEYQKLIEDRTFFWGCSSETYMSIYQERLKTFQNEFFDAKEIDFINKEYDFHYINTLNYPAFFSEIDTKSHKKIGYSTIKKFEFLKTRAKQLGYKHDIKPDLANEIHFSIDNPNENLKIFNSQKIKWSGTDLELSELIKSLIESGKLSGHTDKEIFKTLFEMFGVDYTDSIKKERLATIKARIKDKTPLLEKLFINLKSWIDTKDN